MLFALPDTEFLTAIEHALELAHQNGLHPQRRSLHAYLIDLLGAHSRGDPLPMLA